MAIHAPTQLFKNNKMTKTITFLLATFFTITAFGQSFEGKIVYQSIYKSKLPNVTDAQFSSMMGSNTEYFVKNGNYKSVTNGSFMQWQLYINKDNKLYNKMANSESLAWNDAATNSDEVLNAVIKKEVIEILGYKCDEIILTCKSGTQKYYFNSKLAVDPKLFINHKYGNWYDYISRAKALPLKFIVDNAQFTWESVATEIKEMKLDQTLFELPENVKTVKSPY